MVRMFENQALAGLVHKWNFESGPVRTPGAARPAPGLFDLSEGTVVVEFIQADHQGLRPETLLSRGGYFDRAKHGHLDLRVTTDGRVEVSHLWKRTHVIANTDAGLFEPCDTVRVSYSWSRTEGGALKAENLTARTGQVVEIEEGLSLKIGDRREAPFTFGARIYDSGVTDRTFDGVLNFVAVYDEDINFDLDAVPTGPVADRPQPAARNAPAAPPASVDTVERKQAARPARDAERVLKPENTTETGLVEPDFSAGIMVATPKGERPLGDLSVGDRIITRDNGIQEIRWLGRRRLEAAELDRAGHLKPVLVRAGALAGDLPERDLLLSPNQRVLVSKEQTALHFEDSEVLVAAKHLVGLPGVIRLSGPSVDYTLLMFERHEVILLNGAWTESFQPAAQISGGTGNAQRNELYELFDELRSSRAADPAPEKTAESRLFLVH